MYAMRRLFLQLITVALAFFAVSQIAVADSERTAPTTGDALSGFDVLVGETLKAWNIPGIAIAVVKDGKVVLARGYGARDAATGAPMTAETRFPIASMTKAFVAFDVGLLVDDGKVSLDAPVEAYLPGFALADPSASAGLTLRDMLSHRSGMPRHDALWYHNTRLTRDELLARMPHLAPSAPFRAKWQYNNGMFVLAGLAVERVSGQTWEAFTRDRVFLPLNMTRTTFSFDEAMSDADHMTGTEVRVGKRVDVPLFRNEPLMAPAGGIYSTAEDLSHWMLVQLSDGTYDGKRVMQAATLQEMHTLQMPTGYTPDHPEVIPTGYGLGWFTEIYRGRPTVQHGGNLTGVSTLVTLVPGDRLGVTVLVNQGGAELPYSMTRTILDRFLGLAPIDWNGDALKRKQGAETQDVAGRGNKEASRVKGTKPSHALADYGGVYADPGYGLVTVKVAGDGLSVTFNDDSSGFVPWHYDVFDATTQDVENLWIDGRIQFVTDLAGRISAVSVVMEPQVAPIVFQKRPDARLSDPKYLESVAGTYDSGGRKVFITSTGHALQLTYEGGRPALLIPSLNGEYVHPRALDMRIRFVLDASGRATAFTTTNSAGVFEAKRID